MIRYTVSLEDIHAAFMRWDADERDGVCKSAEEIADLTTEQVSLERAKDFITYLNAGA